MPIISPYFDTRPIAPNPTGIGLMEMRDLNNEQAIFIVSSQNISITSKITHLQPSFGAPVITHTTGSYDGSLNLKILDCITDNCSRVIGDWANLLRHSNIDVANLKKDLTLIRYDSCGYVISTLLLFGCVVSSINFSDNYGHRPLENAGHIYDNIPLALTRKVIIEKTKPASHFEFYDIEISIAFDRFEYR